MFICQGKNKDSYEFELIRINNIITKLKDINWMGSAILKNCIVSVALKIVMNNYSFLKNKHCQTMLL